MVPEGHLTIPPSPRIISARLSCPRKCSEAPICLLQLINLLYLRNFCYLACRKLEGTSDISIWRANVVTDEEQSCVTSLPGIER